MKKITEMEKEIAKILIIINENNLNPDGLSASMLWEDLDEQINFISRENISNFK